MKISFKQNKEKDKIEMLEIKQRKQMSKQGYDQKNNFCNHSLIELAKQYT